MHRPDTELVDADFCSRLGVDLDFDPLLRGYLAYALECCNSKNPPPTDLLMSPENMPYYHGPRFQEPSDAAAPANALHIQRLGLILGGSLWDNCLSFWYESYGSVGLYLISTVIRAGLHLKGTKAKKSLFYGYH